jgi:hypothetical protein
MRSKALIALKVIDKIRSQTCMRSYRQYNMKHLSSENKTITYEIVFICRYPSIPFFCVHSPEGKNPTFKYHAEAIQ